MISPQIKQAVEDFNHLKAEVVDVSPEVLLSILELVYEVGFEFIEEDAVQGDH